MEYFYKSSTHGTGYMNPNPINKSAKAHKRIIEISSWKPPKIPKVLLFFFFPKHILHIRTNLSLLPKCCRCGWLPYSLGTQNLRSWPNDAAVISIYSLISQSPSTQSKLFSLTEWRWLYKVLDTFSFFVSVLCKVNNFNLWPNKWVTWNYFQLEISCDEVCLEKKKNINLPGEFEGSSVIVQPLLLLVLNVQQFTHF